MLLICWSRTVLWNAALERPEHEDPSGIPGKTLCFKERLKVDLYQLRTH